MNKFAKSGQVSPGLLVLLLVVLGLCAYLYWRQPDNSSDVASDVAPAVRTHPVRAALPGPARAPSVPKVHAAAKGSASMPLAAHGKRVASAGAAHTGQPATTGKLHASAAKGRPASAPVAEPVNLFVVPPPPPPPPPPTPVAPPLPFTPESVWQLGSATVVSARMNGTLYLFCKKCDLAGALHPGSIIGGLYQLKSINSGAVEFVYLPLKTSQTLDLNGLR